MKSRRGLLKESRLYVIIDKKITPDTALIHIAKKIKDSPADIIQFRDKGAKKNTVLKDALLLQEIFLNNGKLFIINDYPDIAKMVNADGVHLGQQDMPLKSARRLLGNDKIIGVSCHNLTQALKAQKDGADYIGMGPVFPTRTKRIRRKIVKPGLIKKVKQKLKIPVFAIGGINPDNLERLLAAGINRVAVAGAIFREKNILSAVKRFCNLLTTNN